MNQPTGKEYRNYVKDKVLLFLSFIREKSGDEADFPAGEIANRTDTKYNSIRMLLKRWSQKPFLYAVPHGKVIKRKGFGLVQEIDESRWHLAYHWGYRITERGMNYLQYAQIHHPFYPLAKDTVTRLSSDRIYWFDPVCHGMFVIRPPFALGQDFGQVKLDTLAQGQDHPIDGNTWHFSRYGIEAAFEAAQVGFDRPPSEEFRANVWAEIEKVKKEWLAAHPPFPPTSLPIERTDDRNQYGIPNLQINPEHDTQEP